MSFCNYFFEGTYFRFVEVFQFIKIDKDTFCKLNECVFVVGVYSA